MASNPPKLLGIDVHLPSGEVKRFKPQEIAGYGFTPQGCLVATKHGDRFTRYCNFPTVFHEELSSILVPESSPLVG